jgi:hypothetical protein
MGLIPSFDDEGKWCGPRHTFRWEGVMKEKK